MRHGENLEVPSALRKVVENAGWLLVLRILRILWALFVTAYLARYLGPERFGILSYSIALVALFTPIARFGLEGVVVREIVREERNTDEILGTTFALRLFFSLLTVVMAILTVFFLRQDDDVSLKLVAIISIGIPFTAFDTVDLWFQSRVMSKYSVYARSAALFATNGLKVVLIVIGASLFAFGVKVSLEYITTGIGLVIVYRLVGNSMSGWKPRWTRARELLSKSWPLMLSGALAMVYLRIDQVMLREMVGEKEVGIYSTAVRLSEVWYYVPFAISASVFPYLVRTRELSRDTYRRRFQQLFDILVGIAIVVAVVVTIFSSWIVRVIFGGAYTSAGVILAIHIWAGIFVFTREALGRWFVNEGMMIFSFISAGTGALVNVVLNILLIPYHGAVGAAVATVISYAVSGYLICFFSRRSFEVGLAITRALLIPFRIGEYLGGLRSGGDKG